MSRNGRKRKRGSLSAFVRSGEARAVKCLGTQVTQVTDFPYKQLELSLMGVIPKLRNLCHLCQREESQLLAYSTESIGDSSIAPA